MCEPIHSRFQRAAREVTCLSRRPDNIAKLRLYGLYKQATLGDCRGVRPGMDDPAGRFKHDAWKALAGTSREAAMQEYIAFVEDLKAADPLMQ